MIKSLLTTVKVYFHIGSKEAGATLLLSSSVTLNNFTKLNEEASTWCTEG